VLVVAVLLLSAPPAHATMPGTNGKIAYASNADGDYEIYTMNLDGTGVTQLTNNTASDRNPAWAPGGERIAFDSDRDSLGNEIYTMKKDGTGVTQETDSATGSHQPAFNAGGGTIAFSRLVDGEGEIYLIPYAGPKEGEADSSTGIVTEVLQVTNNDMDDSDPAFAPNDKLAYHRDPVGGGKDNIVVLDANVENVLLSSTPSTDELQANVSPDSTKILYTSGSGSSADIYEMNIDGTNKTGIITTSGPEGNPAYTPSGDKIVYQKGGDIYRASTTGGSITQLTSGAAQDIEPDVAPQQGSVPDTVISYLEVAPENATPPTTEDVTLEFDEESGSEPATSFECRIDGGAWSTCTSPKTYTGLTFGVEHTVEVRGINASGTDATPVVETWTSGWTTEDPGGEGFASSHHSESPGTCDSVLAVLNSFDWFGTLVPDLVTNGSPLSTTRGN
jgi:Tol biopolymer transport system component